MIRFILNRLCRRADDAAIKQAMFEAQCERDRIKREESATAAEWHGFLRDKMNLPDRVRRFDGDMGDSK